jgi:hypothetical protein
MFAKFSVGTDTYILTGRYGTYLATVAAYYRYCKKVIKNCMSTYGTLHLLCREDSKDMKTVFSEITPENHALF